MLGFLPILAASLVPDEAELDLIRRLQNREPQAMADLYDRYGRMTYGLIFRVVRNTATAEDLVQETFLRIWNRVQAFDRAKGALGPWVLTVARNRAIDYLRSVEGRQTQSAFDIEKMEHPSIYADFENEILNLDRVKALKGAFDRLSPNQQQVIQLAYFEGLSQSEMAARLQQPLGTVKTWVRSALQSLREQLGEAATA